MNKPNGGIAASDEIIFAPPANGVGATVYDSDINSEISDDFTLPDYLPEIRRLLRVMPTFPSPSEYIGGSDAEFAGKINWRVLYVGNDGKPATANLSSAYEVKAQADLSDNIAHGSGLHAEHSVVAENVSAKVTAPRKLGIRCRLRHHVKIYGERNTDTEITGCTSDESVKKLEKTFLTLVTEKGKNNSVAVETAFPIEAGSNVIGVRASAAVDSCFPSDSGAVCRGNVIFTLLGTDGENRVITSENTVAFEAPVELDLDGDGWCLSGYACVDEVSSDEAEGSLLCRADITAICKAQKNAPARLTCDIYSTEQVAYPTFGTFDIPYFILCTNTSFGHDGSAVFDGLPEGAEILDCVCDAQPTGMRFENGKYLLDIRCRYNILFGAGDEYTCKETEQSFSAEVGSGSDTHNGYSAHLSVMSCRAKTEGENIALSADIEAAVSIFGEAEQKVVTSVKLGENTPARRAAWTVAYAAPGETLWDIAKRYSADPADLAAANGLKYSYPDAPDSLEGTDFLIV